MVASAFFSESLLFRLNKTVFFFFRQCTYHVDDTHGSCAHFIYKQMSKQANVECKTTAKRQTITLSEQNTHKKSRYDRSIRTAPYMQHI